MNLGLGLSLTTQRSAGGKTLDSYSYIARGSGAGFVLTDNANSGDAVYLSFVVNTTDSEWKTVAPVPDPTPYLLHANDGAGSSTLSNGFGSLSYRKNGAAWAPASRDDLHTGMATGSNVLVVVTISSWAAYAGELTLGGNASKALIGTVPEVNLILQSEVDDFAVFESLLLSEYIS